MFLVALSIQLNFWVFVFGKFGFTNKQNTGVVTMQQQPVSVIICAKNEAENLLNNLKHILEQRYSNFEVIVVNDNSSDDTAAVLKSFEKDYSHLKIVNATTNKYHLIGKRNALLQGIEAAQHEWLMLTDADCKPKTNAWIRYMVQPLYNGKQLSIGFSNYRTRFSLLNLIIQFETIYTAIQYFAFANNKMPYMAVGRNMAYTKSFFYQSKSFYNNTALSGDDDLLVNELVNNNNFGLVWDIKSQTISNAPSTWKAWIQQKIRHYSAGKFYKSKHRMVLATLYLSSLFSTLFAFFVLMEKPYFTMLLGALFVKIIIQLMVSYKLLSKFKQQHLLIWIPIMDFLFPMILVTLATISMLRKTIAWKNN